MSWLDRLTEGLSKSTGALTENLSGLFAKRRLDAAALDELEEVLIAADLGPAAASEVREKLATEKFGKDVTDEEVRQALADVVRAILEEAAEDPQIAQNAPYTTPVRRLDEAGAAKSPVVRWRPGEM